MKRLPPAVLLAIGGLLAPSVSYAQSTADRSRNEQQSEKSDAVTRGGTVTGTATTAQTVDKARTGGSDGERLTVSGGTAVRAREAAEQASTSAQGDTRGNSTGTAATRSMGATGGLWSTLDVDGDGRVSEDEGRVDADFRTNFEMIDADGDGFVSPDEYRDGSPDARTDRGGRDR